MGDGQGDAIHPGLIRSNPVDVLLSDVIDISLGSDHICAVDRPGNVHCWGEKPDQLGQAPEPWCAVEGLGDVREVVLGPNIACALRTQASVACWGAVELIGAAAGRIQHAIFNGSQSDGARAVAATSSNAYLVRADGSLACGGKGCAWDPVRSKPLGLRDPIQSVAAGSQQLCVLGQDGTVFCGQLLDEKVHGLPPAVEITAGDSHGCARDASKQVWCWGAGYNDGGTRPAKGALAAQRIRGLTDVTRISSGEHITCAVHGAGRVSCWNALVNTPRVSPTPWPVPGLTHAKEVALTDQRVCIVSMVGSVACGAIPHVAFVPAEFFGNDSAWRSRTENARATMRFSEVPGLTDAEHLAIKGDSACATRKGGTIGCFASSAPDNYSQATSTVDPCRLRLIPRRVAGVGQ